MKRPCLDCGVLVASPANRCQSHVRQQNARRGTPVERGYGPEHRRLRRQWAPKVARGEVDCARCGFPIEADEEWHLDHADDRDGYLGPSHARCNDSAAGRKGKR